MKQLRRFFLVLAATVVLVGSLLIARLAWAPISLDFLLPTIQRGLNASDSSGGQPDGPPVGLTAERFEIAWVGWSRGVRLRAVGVDVTTSDGHHVRLPEVYVLPSARALLARTLAAQSIVIVAPRVRLRIDSTDTDTGGVATFRATLAELSRHLESRRGGGSAIGYLDTVSITDAHFELAHPALKADLGAEVSSLRFHATGSQAEANLSARILLGEASALVEASLNHRPESEDFELTGTVGGLDTAALEAELGAEGSLPFLESRLAGAFTGVLGSDDAVRSASVSITADAGTLVANGNLTGPVSIDGLELVASYSPDLAKLDRLVVDLTDQGSGPTRLRANGVWTLADPEPIVNLQADVDQLTLARLLALWPPELAPKARVWVAEHIGRADVEDLRAKVSVGMPHGEQPAELRSLDGTFDFDRLDIHPLDVLPEVQGVGGKGVFDQDHLGFDLEKGRVVGLDVAGSDVQVLGLGPGDESVEIQLRIEGPTKGVEQEIGRLAPGLVTTLGLSVTDAGTGAGVGTKVGTAAHSSGRAQIHVPLSGDTETEWTVDGTARVTGLKVDNALVTGPAPASLILHKQPVSAFATLDVSFDLENAGVALPKLQCASPEGHPGNARLVWAVGAREKALSLRVGAPPLAATMSGDLKEDGGLRALEVRDLNCGRTAVGSLGISFRDDLPVFTLDADRLVLATTQDPIATEGAKDESDGRTVAATDLGKDQPGKGEPDKDKTDKGKTDRDDAGKGEAGTGGADKGSSGPEDPAQAFRLTVARVGEVERDGETLVSALKGSVWRDLDGWREVNLSGYFQFMKPVKLEIGPTEDATERRVLLESDDVGSLLRVFNRSQVEGGRGFIRGTALPSLKAFRGEVAVDDFRLPDSSPWLRVLSVASARGLIDLPSRNALYVDRAHSSLRWADDVLQIEDGHLRGSGVGLTALGTFDADLGRLDITGEVLPLANAQRLLASIPLLGRIIADPDTGGVWGIAYELTGPVDEPQVEVNKLATLTPKVLRRVQEFATGKP